MKKDDKRGGVGGVQRGDRKETSGSVDSGPGDLGAKTPKKRAPPEKDFKSREKNHEEGVKTGTE